MVTLVTDIRSRNIYLVKSCNGLSSEVKTLYTNIPPLCLNKCMCVCFFVFVLFYWCVCHFLLCFFFVLIGGGGGGWVHFC